MQRGDVALIDKWARAEAALTVGANIVIELPTPYVLQSAEGFAHAATYLLHNLGVDAISFGSECGDIQALQRVAAAILTPQFEALLSEKLRKFMPFAAARQCVVESIGEAGHLLSHPNNNLGVEYCKALLRHGSDIVPMTVLREGVLHPNPESPAQYGYAKECASSTELREAFRCDDLNCFYANIPASIHGIVMQRLEYPGAASIDRLELAMLASFRTKEPDDFRCVPDVSVELAERICNAVRVSTSLSEVIDSAHSHRYTKSRVRRVLLRRFLGLTDNCVSALPSYARVLAFDDIGRTFLRKHTSVSRFPVFTKAARHPSELLLEAQLTDIYMLSVEHPQPCGLEFRKSPVYKKT